VNNDGWPDLAAIYVSFVADKDYEHIRIYYNDHGTFHNSSDFFLNNPETVSCWNYGDINGDGWIDFVFTSNWGMSFGVIYNDKTGHFVSAQWVPLGFPPDKIYCRDLDNDGRDEVIEHNTDVVICYKLSNGWDIRHIDTSMVIADYIDIADFDQDGLNDVVTAFHRWGGKSRILFYRNIGNRTFHLTPGFEFLGDGEVCATDFNNDGKPDLMLEDMVGSYIWYNQGNFIFADSTFVPIPYLGENRRNFYCEDVDNNGFKDILTVRSLKSEIYPNLDILFNDGNGNFSNYPFAIQDQNRPGIMVMNVNPNPFMQNTVVSFSLRQSGQVNLEIWDLKGRLVLTLQQEHYPEGLFKLLWPGTDRSGAACIPGIYIACLKVNGIKAGSVKIIKSG
jgi:hypothetical protein